MFKPPTSVLSLHDYQTVNNQTVLEIVDWITTILQLEYKTLLSLFVLQLYYSQ